MKYRLKITDDLGNVTYLVRSEEGGVYYMTDSEVPIALSNLLGQRAAEARFNLEDARDGAAAAKYLRGILAVKWASNKPAMPKVVLL